MRRMLLQQAVVVFAVVANGCDDKDSAAGPTPPEEPRGRTSATNRPMADDAPIDAMRAMAAAMHRGDAAAVDAMLYTAGDAEATKFKGFMVSFVELYGASRAKFGQMLPHAYLTIPTEEQIASMRFRIDDDKAVGEASGASPTQLIRVGGDWLVDLRGATRSGNQSIPTDAYVQLGQNARDVAAQIRSGQFATMQQADDELLRRTRQIMSARSTTNPTTRP